MVSFEKSTVYYYYILLHYYIFLNFTITSLFQLVTIVLSLVTLMKQREENYSREKMAGYEMMRRYYNHNHMPQNHKYIANSRTFRNDSVRYSDTNFCNHH